MFHVNQHTRDGLIIIATSSGGVSSVACAELLGKALQALKAVSALKRKISNVLAWLEKEEV